VHAIVADSTLSLATTVHIIQGNVGLSDGVSDGVVSEFHFSRESEYVMSMSRIDDILSVNVTGAEAGAEVGVGNANSGGSSSAQGPVYRIDCIADRNNSAS
jgi:hypothetical protein